MGEVVPVRTSPTLHPPSPPTVPKYPFKRCPSASTVVTITLRVNWIVISWSSFFSSFFLSSLLWSSTARLNRVGLNSIYLETIEKQYKYYTNLSCHGLNRVVTGSTKTDRLYMKAAHAHWQININWTTSQCQNRPADISSQRSLTITLTANHEVFSHLNVQFWDIKKCFYYPNIV